MILLLVHHWLVYHQPIIVVSLLILHYKASHVLPHHHFEVILVNAVLEFYVFVPLIKLLFPYLWFICVVKLPKRLLFLLKLVFLLIIFHIFEDVFTGLVEILLLCTCSVLNILHIHIHFTFIFSLFLVFIRTFCILSILNVLLFILRTLFELNG